MVVQGTRAVFDSMFVNRAVRMDMGNGMALRGTVRSVVVMAVRARSGLRDERRLKGKRRHRRHHHDVGKPLKKRPRT
jgi:hypothetical protein